MITIRVVTSLTDCFSRLILPWALLLRCNSPFVQNRGLRVVSTDRQGFGYSTLDWALYLWKVLRDSDFVFKLLHLLFVQFSSSFLLIFGYDKPVHFLIKVRVSLLNLIDFWMRMDLKPRFRFYLSGHRFLELSFSLLRIIKV